jgi:hypothetical protein
VQLGNRIRLVFFADLHTNHRLVITGDLVTRQVAMTGEHVSDGCFGFGIGDIHPSLSDGGSVPDSGQHISYGVEHYRLAFFTPGNFPWLANSRKHIRHNPNRRI